MLIGHSAATQALLAQLHRFAACAAPVLLEGETGTGKELAAREIHYAGARAEKPFVPVNCGALPDTLIESELFGHRRGAFTDAWKSQPGLIDHAQGGTLFLDEVDSLSPKAQVTLLRFVQDLEYRAVGDRVARAADVRIIAATNASLRQLAGGGGFRSDLLYRLNALYVRIAPLRERCADIVPLARHFLVAAAQRLGTTEKYWSDVALDALVAYAWPGNVRELENVALRACLAAKGDEVGVDELSAVDAAFCAEALPSMAAREPVSRADTYRTAKNRAIASFDRSFLTDLLRRAGGNITAAAKLADIERRQLGKLLKKRGIERGPYTHAS
ncbi:MAG: sigma-54 dependent transcriptional regulator [Dokdonella sp.]